MSEDSSQEKTESATPKRLERARDEGQVPRSRELSMTLLLIFSTTYLVFDGARICVQLASVMKTAFSIPRALIFDPSAMLAFLAQAIVMAGKSLFWLFGVIFIIALLSPILLGGWLFSTKSLVPKLNRMDPISGIKRIFSVKSLMELVKAFLKFFLVLIVAIALIRYFLGDIMALSHVDSYRGITESLYILAISSLILASPMLLVAAIDVPFQLWDHAKKLRMSKQDIRDEMKETDGSPETKGRVRQMQQEMANRRMMSSVPEADVVITNPTHYAVALKYNTETMMAPILVAKGGDEIAMKIREIAKKHHVEQVASPLLARSIFYNTALDAEIPQGLYIAVAQVLAYCFQIKQYREGVGDRPDYPSNLSVPKDLRHD